MRQYIKKSILLTLSILISIIANAYDFEVGGIYYNKDGNCAIVTDGNSKYSGDVSIPSTVNYGGMEYSVTSIGVGAFYGCTSLTSVIIPNSVTSIGNWAFYFCSGLTSVTIPNSVTSIGHDAFEDCTGLTSVHITDLAAWCKIAFNSSTSNPLYYAHHLYLNGEEIKDLVIPNSVTSIGDCAFYECTGLTSVTIPNSVTSIGGFAFYYCTGLTSVTISKSVTSIGISAFNGCSGLISVTIPNSVMSIGDWAFAYCSNLKSVISEIEIPFTIASSVFDSSTEKNGQLTVPKGKKSVYQSTDGWNEFSNIVEGISSAKFPIPEAVDLGLSVKWAKWNMGASSEYDSGDWYGWGDPTGEMTSTMSSDYATGYTEPSICGTSLDIATQNWGEGWRLPTAEEVKELLDNCKRTAVTKNGVAGYNLTLNGETIFLPKGGYKNNGVVSYENYSCYWTGEQDDALHPYELAVYSSTQYVVITNTNKALHLHIRPVYDEGSIPGGGASTNAYDKYAVDLGLSSLWLSVNLGATKSTGIGKYYAWGETEPKTSFKKEEYEYYDASSGGFTDIGNVISDTEYDAVKAAWGGEWHMPTYYDFQELCEQCTWTVVTLSGVQCFEVKGPSGKVIYLPMTGYYTSSSGSPSYETTKARYWSGTLFTLPTSDPIPDSYAYSYNLDINGNPKDSQH